MREIYILMIKKRRSIINYNKREEEKIK